MHILAGKSVPAGRPRRVRSMLKKSWDRLPACRVPCTSSFDACPDYAFDRLEAYPTPPRASISAGSVRRAAASAAGLLLVCCAAWAPSQLAAAEKLLRWKFAQGEQLVVDIAQTTVTEAGTRDKPERMTVEMTLQMAWRVDRVDADGTAQTTQAFRRLTAKTVAPGAPPVVFDSAAGGSPAKELKTLADAVSSLLHARFQVTLTPRGEIADVTRSAETDSLLAAVPAGTGLVRLLNKEGLNQTLRPALGFLPERAVRPGDTWTHTREVETPRGRVRLVSTYTDDGPVTVAARELERIRVSTAVHVPDGEPSYELEQPPPPRIQGVLLFDATAGRLAQSDLSQTLKSQATYRKKTVAVTATTTVTLKIAAAPAQ